MKRSAGGEARSAAGADPRRVVFAADFPRRLEALARKRRRGRGSALGAGASRALGPGDEVLGHRPYRSGEELRHLDWELFARSDRAFVRVFRRAAGERCAVLLDTSASMGLGAPGKLQWAAEVATGIAFLGLATGARTRLVVSAGEGASGGPELAAPTGLADWLAFLAGLEAAGSAGPAGLFARASALRAERLVLIGDLLDLEPGVAASLARGGRRLDLVRVLAPIELSAPADGRAVRWVDPESGAALALRLERELVTRYERALAGELERWDRLARRARVTHSVWSSATPFERAAEHHAAREGG